MIREVTTLIVLGTTLNALPILAQAPAGDVHKRALEVLRKTIAEQGRRPAGVTATNPPAARTPTFAEMERMYLDGKITARQFQQYLEDYKPEISKPAPATNANVQPSAQPAAVSAITNVVARAPQVAVAPKTNAPVVTNAPVPSAQTLTAGGKPDRAAAQAKIAEVEAKMDELLRLKAAREKAAQTNAATANAPKTKRQRLDELLRLHIEGKITKEDYELKRNKIVAEPE